jgi:hypothetical protein
MSAALVMTLVFLTILAACLLRLTLLRRVALYNSEQVLQAEWLAESGIDRAIARLSEKPDYTGETWELSANEFHGRGDASVLIKVEVITNQANARRIVVRADFPKSEFKRARESRTLVTDLTKNSHPESERKGDSSK